MMPSSVSLVIYLGNTFFFPFQYMLSQHRLQLNATSGRKEKIALKGIKDRVIASPVLKQNLNFYFFLIVAFIKVFVLCMKAIFHVLSISYFFCKGR